MALISDVIGVEKGGAFVYGFYGFIERVVNGLIVFLVLNSDLYKDANTKESFIKYTLSLIPACNLTIKRVKFNHFD